MRRLHHPAADVERRADDAVCGRPLHRVHDADDVDDGVEGADLVQMDFLDGHRMNRRLRLAEPLEHRLRALASGRRQARVIDQMEDLGQTPVRVVMLIPNVLV